MTESIKTSVLIAGAGPVGLVLAMELAAQGVSALIIEPRERLEPPNVKCNHVSARSMEIFRRLGVAAIVRDAGLPENYPHDIAYRTTTTGQELTRIPIPCRRDRYMATQGPDTGWPTAEPPHRINQIYLEPILFKHAEAQPEIQILNRKALSDFTQDEYGVHALATGIDDGSTLQIDCDYLIGCDGGKSIVRKKIGAKLNGDAIVQRVQSSYIRTPHLLKQLQHPPAWATFSLNPRRSGNVYAIDGRELWLIHNYLREDEPGFESVDRDQSIRAILGVGADFDYEIISKEDWYGRRLVADYFRDHRVFICGDAAHLWVPYAGYGMNAGIADASNLAWLLSARLQKWGAPGILAAYEAERLPITEQVSHFAMNHAHAMAQQRKGVPADIEKPGIEGEQLRVRLGQQAYELNVQQYCCAGLNFGYFYDKSPLIVYDDETAPAYSMGGFTASTVPGCRAPYFDLDKDTPLYDRLGKGYTLLRFDASCEVAPLVQATQFHHMPLTLLDASGNDSIPAAYRHKMLLLRPDQHIAWRGDALPADISNLMNVLRGATA
ncbi:FAD-dependent oxidoreductase [Paralcaligenes sp. KSB-10]|uniref:FAD-dependent oxidoreductase n=1 Tax=Paralcaligenes sp. KSB-10 TaxID=2901142 RepID=UPI001E64520F|nr:FAD-dependent oxidoreductase [Paralcaligenes sp. KSB-10]UHL62692.1 FAD-dependent oxidoreductase [Paralcaligenes sp. KSB-10]